MDNLNLDNIEQLLQSEPSEKLLFKAIKALKVEKKNRKSRWILVVICCILGSIVGIHQRNSHYFQRKYRCYFKCFTSTFRSNFHWIFLATSLYE